MKKRTLTRALRVTTATAGPVSLREGDIVSLAARKGSGQRCLVLHTGGASEEYDVTAATLASVERASAPQPEPVNFAADAFGLGVSLARQGRVHSAIRCMLYAALDPSAVELTAALGVVNGQGSTQVASVATSDDDALAALDAERLTLLQTAVAAAVDPEEAMSVDMYGLPEDDEDGAELEIVQDDEGEGNPEDYSAEGDGDPEEDYALTAEASVRLMALAAQARSKGKGSPVSKEAKRKVGVVKVPGQKTPVEFMHNDYKGRRYRFFYPAKQVSGEFAVEGYHANSANTWLVASVVARPVREDGRSYLGGWKTKSEAKIVADYLNDKFKPSRTEQAVFTQMNIDRLASLSGSRRANAVKESKGLDALTPAGKPKPSKVEASLLLAGKQINFPHADGGGELDGIMVNGKGPFWAYYNHKGVVEDLEKDGKEVPKTNPVWREVQTVVRDKYFKPKRGKVAANARFGLIHFGDIKQADSTYNVLIETDPSVDYTPRNLINLLRRGQVLVQGNTLFGKNLQGLYKVSKDDAVYRYFVFKNGAWEASPHGAGIRNAAPAIFQRVKKHTGGRTVAASVKLSKADLVYVGNVTVGTRLLKVMMDPRILVPVIDDVAALKSLFTKDEVLVIGTIVYGRREDGSVIKLESNKVEVSKPDGSGWVVEKGHKTPVFEKTREAALRLVVKHILKDDPAYAHSQGKRGSTTASTGLEKVLFLPASAEDRAVNGSKARVVKKDGQCVVTFIFEGQHRVKVFFGPKGRPLLAARAIGSGDGQQNVYKAIDPTGAGFKDVVRQAYDLCQEYAQRQKAGLAAPKAVAASAAGGRLKALPAESGVIPEPKVSAITSGLVFTADMRSRAFDDKNDMAIMTQKNNAAVVWVEKPRGTEGLYAGQPRVDVKDDNGNVFRVSLGKKPQASALVAKGAGGLNVHHAEFAGKKYLWRAKKLEASKLLIAIAKKAYGQAMAS